jgi:hypothetical protein
VDSENTFFEETRARNLMLNASCAEIGRQPRDVKRSMLVYRPLDPWASVDAFYDLVGRYSEIGTEEFMLYWPLEGEAVGQFDLIASEIIPAIRASSEGAR